MSCAHAEAGGTRNAGKLRNNLGILAAFWLIGASVFSRAGDMMKYIIYVIYISSFFHFQILLGISLQFLLSFSQLDVEVTLSAKNLLEL